MTQINNDDEATEEEFLIEKKLESTIENLYSEKNKILKKDLMDKFYHIRDEQFLIDFIAKCEKDNFFDKTNIDVIEKEIKNKSYIIERYMNSVRGLEKKTLVGKEFLNLQSEFQIAQDNILVLKNKLQKYSEEYREWISGSHHITNFIDCAKHQIMRIQNYDIKPINHTVKTNTTNEETKNDSEFKAKLNLERERILLRIKAVESVFRKETREIAANIKNELPRDHLCPYCGKELGNDAHADHIVPVSQGGRSVTTNMVMVCASCNLKKSDLTLREFIIKEHLDRDLIELRLEKLKKRF